MSWREEFRNEVKRVLLDKGMPVKYQDMFDGDENPIPNPYGWRDWDVYQHITGKWYYGDVPNITPCGYVVSDEVVIVEEYFNEFQDTFSGNRHVIGINMFPVACRCGKYTGLTLRHDGTLGTLMKYLLEDK